MTHKTLFGGQFQGSIEQRTFHYCSIEYLEITALSLKTHGDLFERTLGKGLGVLVVIRTHLAIRNDKYP